MKKVILCAIIVMAVVGTIFGVVMANNAPTEVEETVATTTSTTEEPTTETTTATTEPETEPETKTEPTTKATEPAKKSTTTNSVPEEYYSNEGYNGDSNAHVVSHGSDGSVTYEVQKPQRTSSGTPAATLPAAGSNVGTEEESTSSTPTEVVEYEFPAPTQAPATQPETTATPAPAAGSETVYHVVVGDTVYDIPASEFNPNDWVGFDIYA